MSASLHVSIERKESTSPSLLPGVRQSTKVKWQILVVLQSINSNFFSIIRYYKPKTNKKIDFRLYLTCKNRKRNFRIPYIMVIYYLVFSMFIDVEVDNIERDAFSCTAWIFFHGFSVFNRCQLVSRKRACFRSI